VIVFRLILDSISSSRLVVVSEVAEDKVPAPHIGLRCRWISLCDSRIHETFAQTKYGMIQPTAEKIETLNLLKQLPTDPQIHGRVYRPTTFDA